jgi:hypothetical protein
LIQPAAERRGKFRRASRREDQPHLDPKEGIITLPAELTKTGRSRLVPPHADLKIKPSKPDQLVFPSVHFRWAWYKACIAVGAGRWETMATGRKRCVGLLLRNCRHRLVRNASDAGLEEKRIMDISGHRPQSTFDRDNIEQKEDVERRGGVLDRVHKKRQQRL